MAFDVSFLYRIIDRYTPQLQRIRAATAAFGAKLGKLSARGLAGVAKGMGRIIAKGAAFASALSIGAVGLSVAKYADAADELAKLSKAVGTSANSLAGWRHAAELSGLSAGQMDKAVLRLFRNVGDFKSGTGELVTLLKDSPIFADTLRDAGTLEEQFDVVVRALNRIEDPAQKAAAAAKFFGERVGPQMIPLLNEGADGIRQMSEEWKRLHGGFDQEALASAETFNDELGRLQLAITGVRDSIGSALIPALIPLVEKFREWVVTNRDWIATGIAEKFADFKTIVAAIPWAKVVAGAREFAGIALNIARAVNAIVEKIGGWKRALAGLGILTVLGSVIGLLTPIISLVGLISAGFLALAGPIMAGVGAVAGTMGTIVAGLAGLISLPGLLIAGAVAGVIALGVLVVKKWDWIKETATGVLDGLMVAVTSVTDGITSAFSGAFESVSNGLARVGDLVGSIGGFLGIGGDAPASNPAVPTASNPAVPTAANPAVPTAANPAVPTAANPGPLSSGGIGQQALRVQGQIDVGVNGPGTVRETRLTTNPPGNLGFNVADAGAMP